MEQRSITRKTSHPATSVAVATAVVGAIHLVVLMLVFNAAAGSTLLVAGLWTIPTAWVVLLLIVGLSGRKVTIRYLSSARLTTKGARSKSLLILFVVSGVGALVGLVSSFIVQNQLQDLFVPCRDLFGGDPPSCEPWRVIESVLPWAGVGLGSALGWMSGIAVLRRRQLKGRGPRP